MFFTKYIQGCAIHNDIHYISWLLLFLLTKAVKTGLFLRVEHNPYRVSCREITNEKKTNNGRDVQQQIGILHLQRMCSLLLLTILSLN